MRKTLITLSTILALSLAGCATTQATADGDGVGEKAGTNAVAENAAAADETAEPEPEEEEQGPLNLGQAMEWEDGLYVKVSKPKSFKPSQWAAGGKAPHNLAFTVKIVNDTGAMYDASMFSTSMQSGNAEAEEVFDSENGFEGSPMTKVLNGREAVFKIGYNVTTPGDLVMEVSPDWDHEPAIFVS